MTIQWEETGYKPSNLNSEMLTEDRKKGYSYFSKIFEKKIIIPIVISFFGAVFQCSLISKKTNDGKNLVFIASAKRNISRGDALNASQIELLEVQNSELVNEFLTEDDIEKYLDKRLLVNVSSGTPISKNYFNTSHLIKSTPEKIPPGKRLFLLEVNFSTLEEVINPHDHVDIVADLQLPEIGQTTFTILENMNVIGIGNEIEGIEVEQKNRNNLLSFYVTQKEAELLTFAKKYGSFSVILRNPLDNTESKSQDGMTVNHFFESSQIKSLRKNDLFAIIKGQKLDEKK